MGVRESNNVLAVHACEKVQIIGFMTMFMILVDMIDGLECLWTFIQFKVLSFVVLRLILLCLSLVMAE